MKYVITIPYAYRPYYDECMDTIKPPLGNILAVDNTQENKGVAESWNLGIDKLREIGGDWLIVMSAAIRFGEAGGLDMIKQLKRHPDARMVHFGTKNIKEQPFIRGAGPSYDEGNLGWHLTAIHREAIERVGYFDPNFYPAYFEDIDFDLRIRKAYGGNGNPLFKDIFLILPIDAHGTTMGHAVQLGGVKTPVNDLIAYFATKWGVHPSALFRLGSYNRPFNDDDNSLAFFPPAHGRAWND